MGMVAASIGLLPPIQERGVREPSELAWKARSRAVVAASGKT